MREILSFAAKWTEAALDALMPRRARTTRVQALTIDELALSPESHALMRSTITTLLDYRRAAVRDLVQSLKYDGSGKAASLCATALAEYLREECADAKAFSQRRILLVAVPLHAKRERERGFNQIDLVLRALPAEFQNGAIASLARPLTRVRATAPQTHFSRHDRLSNVAGAFACTDERIERSRIYLIDDVATTGATLINAATPLRRAGAEVHLIALARA